MQSQRVRSQNSRAKNFLSVNAVSKVLVTGKLGRETDEHRWAMQDACNDCPQPESSKPSPPNTRSLIPMPSLVILEDKASKDHSKGTVGRDHGWRCWSTMQQTQVNGSARATWGRDHPNTAPPQQRRHTEAL